MKLFMNSEHSQNMNSAIFQVWKQQKIEIENELWLIVLEIFLFIIFFAVQSKFCARNVNQYLWALHIENNLLLCWTTQKMRNSVFREHIQELSQFIYDAWKSDLIYLNMRIPSAL